MLLLILLVRMLVWLGGGEVVWRGGVARAGGLLLVVTAGVLGLLRRGVRAPRIHPSAPLAPSTRS